MNTNINPMLDKSLKTLRNAVSMRQYYANRMEKIPCNTWLRCKDLVDKDRGVYLQTYAVLLNRLVDAGYAKKRTVDDGIVPYSTQEWVDPSTAEGDEYNIPVYDKNGNFVGILPNPKVAQYSHKKVLREVTKYRRASHTEFFVYPF